MENRGYIAVQVSSIVSINSFYQQTHAGGHDHGMLLQLSGEQGLQIYSICGHVIYFIL